MKNSVVIKGNKYGIIVMLDNTMPFEELKEAVASKFKESSKFLGDSAMGITFEGRFLENDEIRELLDVINENSDLNIVCVVDNDKEIARLIGEKTKDEVLDFIRSNVK